MIVAMKKATLYALQEDREQILLSLQRCGEWMLIEPEGVDAPEDERAAANAQKAQASLKFVSSYVKKKPLIAQRPVISYDDFINANPKANELSDRAEKTAKALEAYRSEIASIAGMRAQLVPWTQMDIAMEDVGSTLCTRIYAGYVEDKKSQEFVQAIDEFASVQSYDLADEGRAFLVCCHVDNETDIRGCFAEFGFMEASWPRGLTGNPSEAVAALDERSEAMQKNVEECESTAQELAQSKADLELLYDKFVADRDRAQAKSSQTEATFCLQGWVREDKVEAVQKAVSAVTEIHELSFADPAEDEIMPSVQKENKWVEPFTFVTNLYSRPDPRSIDPNPVMAPFYFVFFGMMLGDAGYGLILTLLTYVFYKIARPKGGFGMIVKMLCICGVSTIICGVLFGGYFGEAFLPPLLFAPMDSPMPMLILCYALGVLHLMTGMVMKIRIDFSRKQYFDAVVDQMSWMALVLGAIILLVGYMLPDQGLLMQIGAVMCIVGALIILLFAGRDKKGIGRIVGGLGALYGATGYLSDILSYSRLFALCLSGGVIAMVCNILAGMVRGIPVVGILLMLVILVAIHAFNLVISGLGSFVHAARLQYIEFFGKFYESGGRAFVPLGLYTKYVDVAANENGA